MPSATPIGSPSAPRAPSACAGCWGRRARVCPTAVRAAVREFFAASIAWVAGALPDALPAPRREAEARSIVAALQGAMILAATFRDPSLLDGAIDLVLERYALT